MRSTNKPRPRVFRFFLYLGLSGIFFGSSLLAEYRVWNSKAGTEVEAQFISQTETHVVLKTKGGKHVQPTHATTQSSKHVVPTYRPWHWR